MLGAPTSLPARQTEEAHRQFQIENMTCFGCARSVTQAVQSIHKGAVINADLENRKVDVETSVTRAEIETVLAEAGYPASREAA